MKTARTWTVRDVMSEDVVTTTSDAPFKVVSEQLLLEGVTALPVLDPSGDLVGVVSESDLIAKQEQQGGGEVARWAHQLAEYTKATGRTAGDLMTSPAITVDPDASLATVAATMHRRGVNQLPVVDDRGQLVGIVTRGDLLKAFLRTDREIELDAAEAVRAALDEPDAVTIAVSDGVVTLGGQVACQLEAEAAIGSVEAVAGVVGVDDQTRAPI